MKRHEFEQEFSAASPYCGAMVVLSDGSGDTCGLPWDDPVHESRYDEYTVILLHDRDAGPGIPLVARLCTDCGSVVVDTAVHDRFHRLHPDPLDLEPETTR